MWHLPFMREIYLNTRFRGELSGEVLPQDFVILTAYATTGETWSEARNVEANARLYRSLVDRDVWMRGVTGYSPTDGHAEPGWAVELPEDEAIMIGREFFQDAIYVVRSGELFVRMCGDGGAERCLGRFMDRVDLPSRSEAVATEMDEEDMDEEDDGPENFGAICAVEWGYELHQVELTPDDWEDIRSGEPVSVDGEGYEYEGKQYQDSWSFNCPSPGDLCVTYDEDEEGTSVGYEGSWQGNVTERTEPS
jgi:hypothetical protein